MKTRAIAISIGLVAVFSLVAFWPKNQAPELLADNNLANTPSTHGLPPRTSTMEADSGRVTSPTPSTYRDPRSNIEIQFVEQLQEDTEAAELYYWALQELKSDFDLPDAITTPLLADLIIANRELVHTAWRNQHDLPTEEEVDEKVRGFALILEQYLPQEALARFRELHTEGFEAQQDRREEEFAMELQELAQRIRDEGREAEFSELLELAKSYPREQR